MNSNSSIDASILLSGGKYEIDHNNKMLPFIFDISRKSLHYINSNNISKLKELMKDCTLLGIDTETKPNFKPNNPHKPKTSLLQIAIRNINNDENVVIIDLLEILSPTQSTGNRLGLGSELVQVEFDTILRPYFTDENILKIGQGLMQDIKELQQSYPHIIAFQSINGILDTSSLMRHLHSEVLNNLSLKKMVAFYLHYNLIKSQQLSNWGIRPLADKQINYAACDALVLLRLYDAMICEAEEKCDDNQFDIKQILVQYDSKIMINSDNSKKNRKRKKNAKTEIVTETSHVFGKEIPCSIVESTGIHTHFDEKNIQNNEVINNIDTNDNNIQNNLFLSGQRGRKLAPVKSKSSANWKPSHSRTVMIVGVSKEVKKRK